MRSKSIEYSNPEDSNGAEPDENYIAWRNNTENYGNANDDSDSGDMFTGLDNSNYNENSNSNDMFEVKKQTKPEKEDNPEEL